MPISRTPKYDAVIEPILAILKPGKRICRVTGEEFEVIPQEIALLRKMRIPPPTTSLKFRRTRLGAFLNYYILHTRKSDKTGKQIISEFSAESPYKVWEYEEWWKDDWSPLDFGRAYDPSHSFFEQFHELDLAVPHPALMKDQQNVRSEYVLAGTALKDCYMAFGGGRSERILYSESAFDSKLCVDSMIIEQCELCYEIVNSHRCYDCQYCVDSDDCVSSRFLFDCRGCSDCFMCSNLRNKKWCFENQQLSEPEYKKRMAEINLGDSTVRDRYRKQFDTVVGTAKHRDVRVTASEASSGDDLRECRECENTFIIWGGEHVVNAVGGVKLRDALATLACHESEGIYESVRMYGSVHISFSSRLKNCDSVEYSVECFSCSYCFGCVGLRNAKFCIFNKQYTEDEYWKLVDEIKRRMLKAGEYGEFFPLAYAAYPYEESLSGTWAPFGSYTPTEAVGFGAWVSKTKKHVTVGTISADKLPADIGTVEDEVLEAPVISPTSGRAFRIIRPELEFYRARHIPLPVLHPDERRELRLARLRPAQLYKRACSLCLEKIQTSLPPERPGQLLCSECYLKEVY